MRIYIKRHDKWVQRYRINRRNLKRYKKTRKRIKRRVVWERIPDKYYRNMKVRSYYIELLPEETEDTQAYPKGWKLTRHKLVAENRVWKVTSSKLNKNKLKKLFNELEKVLKKNDSKIKKKLARIYADTFSVGSRFTYILAIDGSEIQEEISKSESRYVGKIKTKVNYFGKRN